MLVVTGERVGHVIHCFVDRRARPDFDGCLQFVPTPEGTCASTTARFAWCVEEKRGGFHFRLLPLFMRVFIYVITLPSWSVG